MISKHLKIGRLELEKLRNKLQRTQKMKKSRAIVFDFMFCFSFAVEQFRLWRWKANEKTNLMIYKQLKIGRLQLEISRNTFERIRS